MEGEPDLDLGLFARRVPAVIRVACAEHGIPVPRLTVEPGRAIVARAGVTVYRVATVKRLTAGRTFVAVDGGMSHNPRPALYGARYPVRLIGRPCKAATEPMTVVGRHCEAGDVVAADVPLPADIRSGDLVVVPCSGAYHHSMASNYNLVGRAPLIGVSDRVAGVLVRRETARTCCAATTADAPDALVRAPSGSRCGPSIRRQDRRCRPGSAPPWTRVAAPTTAGRPASRRSGTSAASRASRTLG